MFGPDSPAAWRRRKLLLAAAAAAAATAVAMCDGAMLCTALCLPAAKSGYVPASAAWIRKKAWPVPNPSWRTGWG